jgi:hypothetical protein
MEAEHFVVRYFPRSVLFNLNINLERVCGGEFFLTDINLVRVTHSVNIQ